MAARKLADRRWTGELKDFTTKWNQEFETLKEEVAKHQRFATNLIKACRKTTALLKKSQEQMEQDRLELLKSAITEEETLKGAYEKTTSRTNGRA